MKNKKGFTLVELLAVIVILAVVILIAVTAVIPRMNKARESAFIDEALVYMKAAKEAYISNETTECYNIADMGDLVKQNKSGYSGTVYVNEKGVSLNMTNGKYYIKTEGEPKKSNIVTSKPDKFVDSCSDTSKSYTITYDLDGGTVSTANPTSYTSNTATITLNNPTKSGYRFIGWSTKNILKPYYTSKTDNGLDLSYDKYTWYVVGNITNNTNFTIFSNNLPAGTYTLNGADGASNSKYQAVIYRNGSPTYVTTASRNFTISEETSIIIRIYCYTGFNFSNGLSLQYQLEEGTTSTDYQEYMEPTTTAKVYRGSTGNKKFIANWEAL